MTLTLRRLRIEITSLPAELLQLGALVVAVARGLDYIRLPADLTPDSLSVIEAALPFDVWGWIFLTAGAIGLLGIFVPRIPMTALAHGVLFGLYLVFGIGALAELADRDFLYGWRTAVGWVLGAAAVHLVLADASIDGWRRTRAR